MIRSMFEKNIKWKRHGNELRQVLTSPSAVLLEKVPRGEKGERQIGGGKAGRSVRGAISTNQVRGDSGNGWGELDGRLKTQFRSKVYLLLEQRGTLVGREAKE